MALNRRTLFLTGAAFLAATPAFAAGPEVLTPWDEKIYRAAFAAAEQGDFESAENALSKVKDRLLVGQVMLAKLMHPSAYRASYDDLAEWLEDYSDQAGAERVYALAVRRRRTNGDQPRTPPFLTAAAGWQRVESAATAAGAGTTSADRSFRARDAYYSGDVPRALTLASACGEDWIVGLACYRLQRFEEAATAFRRVAGDEGNDEWLRSGAHFWTARSLASGNADPGDVIESLRAAARTPWTFYGMISERKLALWGEKLSFATPSRFNPLLIRASATCAPEPVPAPGLGLIKSSPRARRAAALMQVGRPVDAGQELRIGLALADTDKARREWRALILALNAPITSDADRPRPTPATPGAGRKPRKSGPEEYAAPELWPDGGFTLNKALVYALVRKESGFNPFAVSNAGAVGMMQLLPASAARAAGDDNLLTNILPLFDGPTNLRIGQDYFTWLMERGLGGGPAGYDVLRAVAAYNAGAGTVLNTLKKFGSDTDSLLLIESLPALQTRDYVEKVVAGYWAYRRKFGESTATLDAAARGEKLIDIRIDR
ncbi:soluble lytic murein transglycosylase-like protein [Caulobacter ginsengisoli]|uniref:Soluble lytic murein transglycosylase-like protein n=1 Tax=Caulobacter ginsengisoli TaxID=400775 RepID=A0ABU0IUT5_9CAUL|nr:transglycosylase SLT domain-containing protein [Caulobacter ginsengisoli]MDQ0465769.1 soluble lytic murein transglycosylase-like protein [Caulobacter ginsengisoli]